MPDRSRRSPARLLAPLALVLVAVAIVMVVSSSQGGDDGGGDGDRAAQTAADGERTTERPEQPRRVRYTVKTGDTLGGIAEKTGVPVERLQELNPELDPQALVAGQRIKLRE